jgi:hypothetical protein
MPVPTFCQPFDRNTQAENSGRSVVGWPIVMTADSEKNSPRPPAVEQKAKRPGRRSLRDNGDVGLIANRSGLSQHFFEPPKIGLTDNAVHSVPRHVGNFAAVEASP